MKLHRLYHHRLIHIGAITLLATGFIFIIAMFYFSNSSASPLHRLSYGISQVVVFFPFVVTLMLYLASFYSMWAYNLLGVVIMLTGLFLGYWLIVEFIVDFQYRLSIDSYLSIFFSCIAIVASVLFTIGMIKQAVST